MELQLGQKVLKNLEEAQALYEGIVARINEEFAVYEGKIANDRQRVAVLDALAKKWELEAANRILSSAKYQAEKFLYAS